MIIPFMNTFMYRIHKKKRKKKNARELQTVSKLTHRNNNIASST